MSRSSPAGQQDDLGAVERAAGPADLLVVGHRRGRGAQVHDETEVGLVEAHAQRAGGDQRLDPVGQQVALGGQALLRLGLAGVRGHRVPALAQELGHLRGRGHGERVDDPGPGQLVELGGEPTQALGRGGQRHHRQAQALPVERAAQHERSALLACAEAELFGDVGDHPVVGGGGGREHRDTGRQLGDQRPQPPVVGAEVVAPVGHAVRPRRRRACRRWRRAGGAPGRGSRGCSAAPG